MATDPGIIELVEQYQAEEAEIDRKILRAQRHIHRHELRIDELNNQRDEVQAFIETISPLQTIPVFDATGEHQIKIGSRVEITNRFQCYKNGFVHRSSDRSNETKEHRFGTVKSIIFEKKEEYQ